MSYSVLKHFVTFVLKGAIEKKFTIIIIIENNLRLFLCFCFYKEYQQNTFSGGNWDIHYPPC